MINKLINKILSYHVDAEELKSKNPIIVIRNFLRRNHFIRSIHRWDKCKNNRGLGTFIIIHTHLRIWYFPKWPLILSF